MIIINAKRNGYGPDQCGRTMTVAELISMLNEYEDDEKIYLSHDRGYTYGSITESDFEEAEEDDENDE